MSTENTNIGDTQYVACATFQFEIPTIFRFIQAETVQFHGHIPRSVAYGCAAALRATFWGVHGIRNRHRFNLLMILMLTARNCFSLPRSPTLGRPATRKTTAKTRARVSMFTPRSDSVNEYFPRLQNVVWCRFELKTVGGMLFIYRLPLVPSHPALVHGQIRMSPCNAHNGWKDMSSSPASISFKCVNI